MDKVKIPFLVSWVSQSTIENIQNVTVYVPTVSEYELISHKPMQWALQRCLQRPILFGKDVFFDENYSTNTDATKSKYPFYLWPLANKIVCNEPNSLVEEIYNYGEFSLEENLFPSQLNWFTNLFPLSPKDEKDSQIRHIEYNEYIPQVLLKKIFAISSIFSKFYIFWIEDQERAFKRAGLKPESEDDKVVPDCINLHYLEDEKTFKIITHTFEIEKVFTEFKKFHLNILQKITNKLGTEHGDRRYFKVFIIDMYFTFREKKGSEPQKKIIGDNFINWIRSQEKTEGELKSLIIVFTHGCSPYVVSEPKRLTQIWWFTKVLFAQKEAMATITTHTNHISIPSFFFSGVFSGR